VIFVLQIYMYIGVCTDIILKIDQYLMKLWYTYRRRPTWWITFMDNMGTHA